MSQPTTRQIIAKQVTRARRRLILQVIAPAFGRGVGRGAGRDRPSGCSPSRTPSRIRRSWLRWAVLGGTARRRSRCVAILQTIRRAPSRTDAALALDDRFGLRERVVTVLSLTPDLDATPAGVALLADAEGRVKAIRVRERFPVGLPWSSALVPAGGLGRRPGCLLLPPVVPGRAGRDRPESGRPGKEKGNREEARRTRQEAADAGEAGGTAEVRRPQAARSPAGRNRQEAAGHDASNFATASRT